MTAISPRFFPPDHRYRTVDRLFPGLGIVFGLSACVLLWAPATVQMPRVPLFFGGWLLGLVLPRLYKHPGRCLGIAAWTASSAAVIALVSWLCDDWTFTNVGLFSLSGGLTAGVMLRYRDRFRTNQKSFLTAGGFATLLGLSIIAAFLVVGRAEDDWKAAYAIALVVVSLAYAVLLWFGLTRLAIEFTLELPFRTMYNVTHTGPGAGKEPLEGPCLIIANHAAWFDPIFIGKINPRELTPMMTASFYDIRFITPLMKLCHVIRVPEKALKRDAPEVLEAIAAIQAGRCVLIFPEGYLRRKEEQVIRRFGQGVWQILAAKPDTPVVPCWIEGSWGSFFSYFNGPPTKNKRFDFRRRLHIVVNPPLTVPAEILADQMHTRHYLMMQVLAARSVLGLPAIPPDKLPIKGDD